MSLTMGSAPFGTRPGGRFNFEHPRPRGALWFEDSPRRVRGEVGGELVVDSRRVKLLHETGHLPVWYFPREDVRAELLERSEHTTRCPWKGETVYWHAGHARDAAWEYPEPNPEAEFLRGHLAFHFDRLDRWWEEDEEVFVHPRDPYHRVDALPSSRRVRLSVDGQVLADSDRTVIVFETGLPPRFYFPPDDVRQDLFESCELRTACPYKGNADYASVAGETGLAWRYPDPVPAVAPIAGRWSFFQERADLEVDGEAWERPRTPWSKAPAVPPE